MIKEVINSCDEKNNALSKVIANHLCLIIGKNLIVSTGGFFYTYNSILNVMVLCFVFVSYIIFFIKHRFDFNIRYKTFIGLMFIVGFIFVSYLLDQNLFVDNSFPYSYVRKQFRLFIVYGFPLFIGVSSLIRMRELVNYLYDRRYYLFTCATIGFIFSFFVNKSSNDYSMSFGNNVLFVIVLFWMFFLKNEKKIDLIAFCLLILYVFISGSRGPIVSIISIILLWIFYKRNSKKTILTLLLIIITFLFILINYQIVISMINSLFQKFGIESRTFSMLSEDKIIYDSGRSEYHEKLIEEINKHPLIGLGAFGGEKTVGLAHSFYLDIFANFGYVFGIIFLFYVLVKSIKILKDNIEMETKSFLIMQLVILLPRGFFDETFWGAKEIWIVLAIFIMYDGTKKEKLNHLLLRNYN